MSSADPSATHALQAIGLSKAYGGTRALEDVSLEVERGECVALVGESGSGKSSLLHCFNRVVVPERGRLRVRGRPIEDYDEYELRRTTGFVPQDSGLLPHWTALKNAALVPRLVRLAQPKELAREALRLVGLGPELERRRPWELSGGQRQRVAFARAIAARPDIVLLDEPFGALDAITRGEVRTVYSRLRAELGFASLLVTHDVTEACEVGDRILVLKSGRVQQVGTPAEITSAPANDYVRRLVSLAGTPTC